jgi:beta-glucosidase
MMKLVTRGRTLLVLALLLCGTRGAYAQQKSVPQLGKNTVKEVIAAMTLEEKVELLVGTGRAPKPKPAGKPGESNGWVPEPPMIGHTNIKVPGAAGNTAAVPRLNIPSLVLADGPAGVRIAPRREGDSTRTYFTTAFPVGTLLASSWDPQLVETVGRAFGEEAKEYGVDILLAPGVNIHRNPLNGRNFEYYSEDPLVAGRIAAAFINGVQSKGVGTSIKHYAANNQESNRNYVSSTVSERALREIYLRPFQLAVAGANPWTVMSSYNRLNGVYTAERYDLLTTVLRDEWKFRGLVMTDWGGGYDWVAEMKAGNDLIMPGRPDQKDSLLAAVKKGTLPMAVLDRNVERILRVVLLTPAFKNYAYSNAPDLQAHALVARQAATEGMVLLKNNGALPIAPAVKTIAAFGNATYRTLAGGTGSGDVNKAYMISIAQGLAAAGYNPDAALQGAYEHHFATERERSQGGRRGPSGELVVSDSLLEATVAGNDLAVVTIGRNGGEGHDRNLETNYRLTPDEQQQFRRIAAAFHAAGKKVVAVLNIGGVIDMGGWSEAADAVLLAWQPGQEGGHAVADVLSGKVNPSGKLATTFPAQYSDVPSAKNFPGTPAERPERVLYEEGIYVGYRYFDRFGVKPAYEFGYGLSYTTFDISSLQLSATQFKGSLKATVTVKNTGTVAGREVVQLYVGAPGKAIDKPAQELRAFAKSRLLQPGESEVLTFTLRPADLASYHPDRSAWIAEAGAYVVRAGASSRDIRQAASFSLPKEIVVEKGHKVLQPDVELKELKGENRVAGIRD